MRIAAEGWEGERISRQARAPSMQTPAFVSAGHFAAAARFVSGAGLIFIDTEGRIRSWNLGASELTGWRERDVLGRPYADLFDASARDSGMPERLLACARSAGRVRDVCPRSRSDGSAWQARTSLELLRNPDGTLAGYAETVTLWLGSVEDPGRAVGGESDALAFRASARSELDRARRFAEPISLVMIELQRESVDGSRQALLPGDEALPRLLAAWRQNLRGIDICARIGVGRIAVMMPRAGKEPACEIINRLRHQAMAQRRRYGICPRDGLLTVSAGLATARAGQEPLDLLWRQAERALDQALVHGNHVAAWFE